MKNSIEELKQRLDELYKTQQARLDVGADDLDIREEIAEVEETIKDLQDETTEKNSVEEDITKIEGLKYLTLQATIKDKFICAKIPEDYIQALEHILSDYKRALKENEELKKSKITYEKVRDIQEKNKNIVDNNYIPIQKVKDKIEEIQKDKDNKYYDMFLEIRDIDNTIIVLQELIEGKK